jgi:5'-3' exonuclease
MLKQIKAKGNFGHNIFIPYYLINHVLDKNDVDESCNIIYSTDKDLCQCLTSGNIFQFYRHYKKTQMLSEKDIFLHWLKEDINIENAASWLPLALSIVGDSSDGIPGVGGIAAKTIVKIFPIITKMCGSMDKVYQNIYDKKCIFDKSYIPENNSVVNVINSESVIIRNLKLTSFKMLSDYVNGGYPTDMIEKKKQILENVGNTYKADGPQVLFNALVRTGMFDFVSEKTIVNLF